jgi:hypothetical protein
MGNTVTIPTNTLVATDKGIQFATTANGVSRTSCANDQAPIPVQAVQGGDNGNVPAGSITIIPPESLNTIAQQNGATANTLKLTVSNAGATNGGGSQSVPAITDADREVARVNLRSQLKQEIADWVKGLSQDGITGDPTTTKAVLVNTEPKGTAIEKGDTFAATVDVTATVLFVRTADLQKAALPQLKTTMSQDKAYNGYVIVENINPPVAIKPSQTRTIDAKSLRLTFDASTVTRAMISDETVQNTVKGRSPGEAQNLLKAAVPGTQKADIQIQPSFLPWLIPFWSSHIHVTILPDRDPNGHPITNKS